MSENPRWSYLIRRNSENHPFSFRDLIALQDERLKALRPEQASELLFAEVAPVVTLGARQMNDEAVVKTLTAKYAGQPVDIFAGERGGNETWHGPGQWIVFVLTPLEKFTGDSKGVRLAVHKILEVMLETCKTFYPSAYPSVFLKDGAELGVWSEKGKLVSVGIKIRDGYITSGAAINCLENRHSFANVNPCGLNEAKADFLFQNEIDSVVAKEKFEGLPSLIQKGFEKIFQK